MSNRSFYLGGLSDAMALAAHRVTGLPMAVWAGVRFDDAEQKHWDEPARAVVVDRKENRWFDADGWHEGLTPPEGLGFGGIVFHIKLQSITPEEMPTLFSTEGVAAQDIEEAMAFIEDHGLLQKSQPASPAKPSVRFPRP